MNHIDRYICKAVFSGILLVFAVLLGLDILFSIIDQLDDMQANYQIPQVIWYTLLSTPARLYEYIPAATLIGCLLGLGTLAATSELTVVRAAGTSLYRILAAMAPALLCVILLGLFLGEYGVPYLERTSQAYREISQGGDDVHDNKDIGYWHKEGNTFMRFNAIEPKGIIHGITLYSLRPNQSISTYTTAQKAYYLSDITSLSEIPNLSENTRQGARDKQPGWILESVKEIRFDKQHSGYQQRTANREFWNTELTPDSLKFVAQSPAFMAMSTLYQYAHFLENEGLKADEYRLAFWKKLLQPLSLLALILIGASFVFGPLRSVSMGQRLFSGILVGIGYKFTLDLLGPAGLVLGITPFFANLIPIFISILLGVWLLRRVG